MDELQVYPDVPENKFENYYQLNKLAVDTELHGLQIFRDQICLVQICDERGLICLIRPEKNQSPRLRKLMENPKIIKVFHYALTDVTFFLTSLGWKVSPFCCTKVMSKLIRTYTQSHGLKDLHKELLGVELEKEQQQTNWANQVLSQKQLRYASNDVLHLLEIYEKLKLMMSLRAELPGGRKIVELNELAQGMLPGLVELIVHGYGDLEAGWQTSLFAH